MIQWTLNRYWRLHLRWRGKRLSFTQEGLSWGSKRIWIGTPTFMASKAKDEYVDQQQVESLTCLAILQQHTTWFTLLSYQKLAPCSSKEKTTPPHVKANLSEQQRLWQYQQHHMASHNSNGDQNSTNARQQNSVNNASSPYGAISTTATVISSMSVEQNQLFLSKYAPQLSFQGHVCWPRTMLCTKWQSEIKQQEETIKWQCYKPKPCATSQSSNLHCSKKNELFKVLKSRKYPKLVLRQS